MPKKRSFQRSKKKPQNVTPSPQTLSISEVMELAFQYHQEGELSQAKKLYQQVLQVEPHHSEALHLLGVIATQEGNYETAVDLINQAILIDNSSPSFYNNLGNALWHLGLMTDAVTCFQQALALNPHFTEAYNNLGNVFKEENKLHEATTCYQQALVLNPNYTDAYYNLGLVFSEQGKVAEAIAYYQQLLTLEPNYTDAYYRLGEIFKQQGQLEEAANCYQHLLAYNPNDAEALNILGNVLSGQGQLFEAMGCYQRALALNPTYVEAHNNLGNALRAQGKLSEAVSCFQRALTLAPQFAEAHNNLGVTLQDQGRAGEAIQHYKAALAIKPTMAFHTNLLLTFNYVETDDLATIFAEHQRFNELYAKPLATASKPHRNSRDPHRRLKIGYVSTDFWKHSVSYFLEPILTHHDHHHFEIFCYYNKTHLDEVTSRMQQATDHWLSCVGLSDEVLADQIREAQIDILVDLVGHIDRNRLLVFARQPAPVQVTYLGYTNTTGLTAIDYRITDGYTDPEGKSERFNSETLVRLPGSYFCYRPDDDSPAVNELPALRQGYITFGSLNNTIKLSPRLLTLWAKVLDAVPNSKLLLKPSNLSLNDPATQQAWIAMFRQLGIAPERLLWEGFTPTTAYLNSYHQIDIALDSFPFNGATTTCAALWMGVPVVTLVGEKHASRMGLSILSAVGLTELIAYTPEEFVKICVTLANDVEWLQSLRQGMRERLLSSSLLDASSFTRNLEAVYRQMWEKWCQNMRN
jgi:predicted O-linked N-acetylglucosamine transferase (SPINDLY family)